MIRIRDNLRLKPNEYRIKVRGEEVARGEIYVDRHMAIPSGDADSSLAGIKTQEPAFGLPAVWIGEAEKGRAELMGYTVVSPLAVLSTHLTEVIRKYASGLLSRQMIHEMLDHLRKKAPAAVEGVIPEKIALGEFQRFEDLLRERIPIPTLRVP